MHQGDLALFVVVQQRQATQPVEQWLAVRRLEDFRSVSDFFRRSDLCATASRCRSWLPRTLTTDSRMA